MIPNTEGSPEGLCAICYECLGEQEVPATWVISATGFDDDNLRFVPVCDVCADAQRKDLPWGADAVLTHVSVFQKAAPRERAKRAKPRRATTANPEPLADGPRWFFVCAGCGATRLIEGEKVPPLPPPLARCCTAYLRQAVAA